MATDDQNQDFNALDRKISDFKTEIGVDEKEKAPGDIVQKIRNPAVNLAIEMAASLAVGVVVGVFADQFFHTKPVFILLGIFFGMVAGGYNFYRLLKGAGMAGMFKQD